MARITHHLIIAAIVAVGMMTFQGIPEAAAQTRCADRAKIVEWLEGRFGETLHGMGLVGDHTVIELHVSERGTWTVLSTGVTGQSCMVSAGHSWSDIRQPEGVETGFAPHQDRATVDKQGLQRRAACSASCRSIPISRSASRPACHSSPSITARISRM